MTIYCAQLLFILYKISFLLLTLLEIMLQNTKTNYYMALKDAHNIFYQVDIGLENRIAKLILNR
jgi:hypothetical protein